MTQRIEELIRKYRFFGWPLLSIEVSLLLLIFLIIPQIIAFFNTNKLISDTQQRVNSLNTKAQTLASIKTDEYQSNLNLALAVLPENRDIPTAIGQVQTVVGESGLQLGSVSFAGNSSGGANSGTAGSGSSAQSYEIKIEVLGSPNQLNALFSNFNNGPEIMKLNGLGITSSGKGLLDASLTLSSYYQGPPAVLGDVEKPIEGMTPQEIDLLTKIQKQVPPSIVTSSSINLPPRGKPNPFQ